MNNRNRAIARTNSQAWTIKLSRSEKPDKKFKVKVGAIGNKTIHFGSKGMSDYTINKDPERKRLYIIRHSPKDRPLCGRARENWSKSGILTPGFWTVSFEVLNEK